MQIRKLRLREVKYLSSNPSLQKYDSNPDLAAFSGMLLTITVDYFIVCLHKEPVIRYVLDVLR